ncbi:MAG: M17 family metallopeptidase [Bacilli bacterium]
MKINQAQKDFKTKVIFIQEGQDIKDVVIDYQKKDTFQVFKARHSDELDMIYYIISKDQEDKGRYELLGGSLITYLSNDQNVLVEIPTKQDLQISDFIIGLGLGCYSFDKYHQTKSNKDLLVFTINALKDIDESLINEALIKVESINMARTLVNEPSNELNPDTYETFITSLYQANPLVEVEVYKGQSLIDYQLNGLYHVGKASQHQPRLIVLSYQPNLDKDLIALVGKGLTFDSGGMNLKTSRYVGNMKTDMAGSAYMLGAFDILVKTNSDVNVKCYLPICENAISKEMQMAGETITYPNGLCIEVGNTDAEGRLVLADALLMASNDGAKTIIDAATLTGAMVMALGDQIAGVFSNDKKLAKKLVKISNSVNEPLWHMPIIKKYEAYLDSDHADYMNIALNAPGAGASTAASFLNLFIDDSKVAWAHLDIAGTAYTKKFNYLSKATGFGIKTITNFVLEQ